MEKQINQEHVSVAEYLAYFSYGFGQCFSFGIIGSFILIWQIARNNLNEFSDVD